MRAYMRGHVCMHVCYMCVRDRFTFACPDDERVRIHLGSSVVLIIVDISKQLSTKRLLTNLFGSGAVSIPGLIL